MWQLKNWIVHPFPPASLQLEEVGGCSKPSDSPTWPRNNRVRGIKVEQLQAGWRHLQEADMDAWKGGVAFQCYEKRICMEKNRNIYWMTLIKKRYNMGRSICMCICVCIRDVPGTNFLPGTEYRVLRRFFTGSGYRVFNKLEKVEEK